MANGIALGSTNIDDLQLGSTQVDKVYLGSVEVWAAGGGSLPYGENLVTLSKDNSKVFLHTGFSTTVTSFAAPGAAGNCKGVTYDGTNLLIGNESDNKIYEMSGKTSTIGSSFAAPSTGITGLTYDGTNLISCDWTSDKIYIHSGKTTTISSSFSSPGTSPTGLGWDDSNSNLLSVDATAQKIFVHSGKTSTISSSFATGGGDRNGMSFDGTNAVACIQGVNQVIKFSGLTSTVTATLSGFGADSPWGLAYTD